MTSPAQPTGPFDVLDRDWAYLCRRHRRSGVVAGWAEQEPALAHVRRLGDVIPPPDVDRIPTWDVIARLHAAGDDLAGRVLLQLLVPGMVRLAAQRGLRPGADLDEVGWDVIARAHCYIARLRGHRGTHHSAFYVLRSVMRDIDLDEQKASPLGAGLINTADGPEPLGHGGPKPETAPSAEHVYFSTAQVHAMLTSAVERRAVSPDAAQATWLFLSGHNGRDVTDRSLCTPTTVYRHHAATVDHLRRQLQAAS